MFGQMVLHLPQKDYYIHTCPAVPVEPRGQFKTLDPGAVVCNYKAGNIEILVIPIVGDVCHLSRGGRGVIAGVCGVMLQKTALIMATSAMCRDFTPVRAVK
jgi:hypothetical protein